MYPWDTWARREWSWGTLLTATEKIRQHVEGTGALSAARLRTGVDPALSKWPRSAVPADSYACRLRVEAVNCDKRLSQGQAQGRRAYTTAAQEDQSQAKQIIGSVEKTARLDAKKITGSVEKTASLDCLDLL